MTVTDNTPTRSPVARLRPLATAGRAGVRALRLVSPALVEFITAKRPQVKLAFGRREIHLRRDGLVVVDRQDPRPATMTTAPSEAQDAWAPLPFVPRRPGEQTVDRYMFRTPPEGLHTIDPSEPFSLKPEQMKSEVRRRMGERPEASPDDLILDEAERSVQFVAAEIARVRDLLQALDDVEDHELIKALTEDMYQLYKAVDYKIKRHHASEAKVELGKLFKM